jgi:hypothetical protein
MARLSAAATVEAEPAAEQEDEYDEDNQQFHGAPSFATKDAPLSSDGTRMETLIS